MELIEIQVSQLGSTRHLRPVLKRFKFSIENHLSPANTKRRYPNYDGHARQRAVFLNDCALNVQKIFKVVKL